MDEQLKTDLSEIARLMDEDNVPVDDRYCQVRRGDRWVIYRHEREGWVDTGEWYPYEPDDPKSALGLRF